MTLAEEDVVASGAVSERRATLTRLALVGTLAVALGLFAATIWRAFVTLPNYVVQADGSATITERGLTEIFASDAWFTACGAVVGLVLGLVVWKLLGSLGWLSAVVAVAAGLLSGAVCWQLGPLLGPGNFDERLAAARPGDLVPIAFELHAVSALAAWGFSAVTPILLGSALGPDESLPREPRRRRIPGLAPDDSETVDERGVATADDAVRPVP
ncbi:MAG: hypothetical protein WAS07_06245 [Micropruina sp.]